MCAGFLKGATGDQPDWQRQRGSASATTNRHCCDRLVRQYSTSYLRPLAWFLLSCTDSIP
jgi:hypothetical protein